MKGVIIAIVVVVALGGGGYGGYVMGYSGGEEAGYNTGYPAGQEAAYSQGHEEGYDEGSTAGYDEGKDDGYTEGYNVGKDDGYTEGHNKGYLSGKQDGRAEGYSSGKTEGYAEGLADGKQEGYDEGHTTGYDEGLAAGGAGYTIRDPTYAEVIVFLLNDTTDSNDYIDDIYVCEHFARDVCNNAEEEGLRCAFVGLRYPNHSHAIIAFNTSDQGLIYFDPQVDARVEPVVGKKYHECVEGRPFSPPPIDDTIMDILVIW